MTVLRRLIVGSILFLMGCQSCEQSSELQEQAEELAEISTGIQFASVKELGSHQMVAQINRRVERDGVVDIENDETLILVWANDDSFQIQGLRDGRMMEEFVVHQGTPYKRKKDGSWVQTTDAEPVRVKVNEFWNVWDVALDKYRGRIKLVDPVPEVYEGRDAQRYTVALTELGARSKKVAQRLRKNGLPVHLDGQVWLDSQTAVRLKAEVTGVWQKGTKEEIVQFTMERTDLGTTPEVGMPDGVIERRFALPQQMPLPTVPSESEPQALEGEQ